MDPKAAKAIRNQYSELGVEAYYRKYGGKYANPHFPQVRALLLANRHRIDYAQALDFCCGGGEVSMVLQEMGYDQTQGSDPFTQALFETNLGRSCLPLSFQDVVQGKLHGRYSSIICSFAMHLCPEKQLYPLAMALFRCTDLLVVITPHKRPVLERLDGVRLAFEDFVLTDRGKRVRLKAYALLAPDGVN